MDGAAWDRRAIFQRTTPESEALKARSIGDFGTTSTTTSRVNAAPPPVVTADPSLAKQEQESQMVAALVQRCVGSKLSLHPTFDWKFVF